MSQHDDTDLDNYLRGNSRVSKLYKGMRDGGPSAALDEKILARAHEALTRDNTVMKRKPRPGWLIPLSVAATVLLGVNLAFNLKDFKQDSIYTRSNGFIVGDEESTGVTQPQAAVTVPMNNAPALSESTVTGYREDDYYSAPEAEAEAELQLERLRSLKQVQDEQRRQERGIVDVTANRALRQSVGQAAPAVEAAVPPADSASGADKNSITSPAPPPPSAEVSEREVARFSVPSPAPDRHQQPEPPAGSATRADDGNATNYVPPPPSANATEHEVAHYSVPSPPPEGDQQPARPLPAPRAAALDYDETPASESPEVASGRARSETDGVAQAPDASAQREADEDHADLADVAMAEDTYIEISLEEIQLPGNTSATRKIVDSANKRPTQNHAYRCDLKAMGISPEAITQARQAAVNAVPALSGADWVNQIRELSDAQSHKDACISLAAYIEVYGRFSVPDDLPLILED